METRANMRFMPIMCCALLLAFTVGASAQVDQDGGFRDGRTTDTKPIRSILIPANERSELAMASYRTFAIGDTAHAKRGEAGDTAYLVAISKAATAPATAKRRQARSLCGTAEPSYTTDDELNAVVRINDGLCDDVEPIYIATSSGDGMAVPILKILPAGEQVDVRKLYADDREVIHISYYSGGTGGTDDEMYLLSRQEKWIPLMWDESWSAVIDNLPSGFRLHKSAPIDFRTMHWGRSISTDADPNCCPSGVIDIKLSIKEDRLHVDNYRYRLAAREDLPHEP